MFMYDDRGEVITKNKETIRSLSALMGSKTPTSKFSENKEVRWRSGCP